MMSILIKGVLAISVADFPGWVLQNLNLDQIIGLVSMQR